MPNITNVFRFSGRFNQRNNQFVFILLTTGWFLGTKFWWVLGVNSNQINQLVGRIFPYFQQERGRVGNAVNMNEHFFNFETDLLGLNKCIN